MDQLKKPKIKSEMKDDEDDDETKWVMMMKMR